MKTGAGCGLQAAAGFLVLLFAALSTAPLSAHPAGTTAVSIVVRADDTVDLLLTSPADVLITKLEALAALPASAPATRDDRARRLTALRDALLSHVELRADGRRVPIAWRQVTVDGAGVASVRVAAQLPSPTAAIAWRTDLIFGSYPLGVARERGEETVVFVAGAQPSDSLRIDALAQSMSLAAIVWMGFTHILPKGIDHILFVIGLFLLARGWRDVLVQVSAFTLAHSITLGLGLFGLVTAPAAIVEPLIALSVAYVGIENFFAVRRRTWRVVVVFTFGLLHGLGFAEALSSLSLTRADLAATLIAFNAGVELGQLSVIALAALAGAAWLRLAANRPWPRLVSAGIGLAGVIWTIERVI